VSQQTEDTAKQREQLRVLAMVAARTDNAVILTNPQGLIEWVNEGFTRLTGYTLPEVHGRKPGAVLQGPGTSADTVRYMRESLAQRQAFTSEVLNYARDGRPYWVHVEVQPLFDEQGELTHFMAIERDITQRRDMEHKLAESEERLRLALDSTEEGLWDWNVSTGTVVVNSRFRNMLGYVSGELEPTIHTWRDFLCHPEDLPEADRRLRAHIDGTTPIYEMEHRLRKKGGEWLWVLVRAKVVARSEDGRALRLVGTNLDITARKRSEELLRQQDEALRRHRDQLEERVWETARQLEAQQVQLIQAEKMASLGQMAAGIAHEVNNPMGYITSNLNTLGEYARTLVRLLRLYRGLEEDVRSGQPPSQELLERIGALREEEQVEDLLLDVEGLIQDCKEGTHRVTEIVQGLRMFSRTDAGTLQPSDLNKVMDATIKLVRHQIKYKCEVRCDYGPLPLVACHPTQVSQVFTNLLVNAAQAIDTRGEIRITTRHEGGQVVVRVADTGSGMSQETQARLFTPFFTTKPQGEGTGLGLSICSSIIQRHQGRIEVQSEVGKGSTFIVRLPVTAG
jgi:PAS domain S-box-containing protein